MKKILQNAIKCPDGYILNSCEVHDFQEHNGYFVDGGLENYTRCGYPCNDKDFEPLFIYENDDFQIKKEKLVWGTYGKNGKNPLKWVKLIDCEDDHLKAILKIDISDLYKKVINTILEERLFKFRRDKLKKILQSV